MHRRFWAVIATSGAVALSACTGQQIGAPSTSASTAPSNGVVDGTTAPAPSPTTTTPKVAVRVSPGNDAADVRPDARVRVTATGGTLTAVRLTSERGETVTGVPGAGGWTSTQNLKPATTYTVTATSTAPDGSHQVDSSSFRTLTPSVTATYHVLYDGQTVGVGAPVTIQFDTPVATKQLRQIIEKHAVVTTSPKVEGSWGWLDHRQLMWRPRQFWQPGTRVSLDARLQGLQTGESKWIAAGSSGSFRIGSSVISTVDIPGHTMTVTENGKVVRVMPVSAGSGEKPEFVTRSGTKVIIERKGDMTMDSETVGIPKDDPDYYKVETKNNLRVTWTGEFLHSAPWSVGSQGAANVSHGCVNMAPKDAQWMFDRSKVGDVVRFTGSDRPFKPTEGIGVWQYTYDQWRQRSALVD